MQLTDNAKKVLEKRYLKRVDGKVVESPEDMMRRVAQNIASVDGTVYGKSKKEVKRLEDEFFGILDRLEFVANSPTLMNAGRELQQLAACFVLPVEDSMESIFETIKHMALIQKSGGGTGFSFSRLRPKNDQVLSTGGVASGPISFLKVFDAATESVKQGGTRRGANMGILRVDHPDILEFIKCKQDNNAINNFNISVGLTEAFMKAVDKGEEYDLINPRGGKPAGRLNAREVFGLIVEMAWSNGEPGIIFLDRLNAGNPTPHVGEIESTNPCGEQPLLPYESCVLGSVNLARMVDGGQLNWQKLSETTQRAVHFLDNVIDANRYPIDLIENRTKANRKIGLGVMGWADLLVLLGVPYDSPEGVELGEKVMAFILAEATKASEALATERGTFPNFKGSIWDAPGKPNLRNATLTTIAPTGTISIIANCSSGVEPLFALAFTRNVMDNTELVEVNPLFEEIAKREGFHTPELMKAIARKGTLKDIEAVPEKWRRIFVTAHDITPEWHIRMQAAFQKFTHNAVSKTVNAPSHATREDIGQVYRLAYELGCKGATVYRDGSRDQQVLTVAKNEKKAPEPPQPVSKEITPRPRPNVTTGRTEKVKTGCGNLYVTINEDGEGLCEVFARMGKSGGCAASQSEATARLISMALRSGLKVEAIIPELRGIRCPSPYWNSGGMVLSCADAIGIVMERYVHWKKTGETDTFVAASVDHLDNYTGACPECGGHLKHESGCSTCVVCGYSKCS